jgi:hypothetical protein
MLLKMPVGGAPEHTGLPRGQKPTTTSVVVRQAPPVSQRREMLTDDEVRDRLAINSPELVAELLTLVQGQLAAETGRQTRIEGKATSLLTAAGLSLTVAFSFGGLLISKENRFTFPHFVIFAFILALVLGLSSAICAVAALFVRGKYRAPEGTALFDPETLALANATPKDETPEIPPRVPSPGATTSDKDEREYGLMAYRKYLIPHFWDILRCHRLVHEEKAKIIKVGQGLFVGFLGVLMVIGVTMAYVVARGQ